MRCLARTGAWAAPRVALAMALAGCCLSVEANPTGPNHPHATDAPPPAQPVVPPQSRQTLWERVEDAWDRGTGRVIDEPTYQVKRLENARDERLRRIPSQRPTEQFQEDVDRRHRVEGLAVRSSSSRTAPLRTDRLPRVSADPATASIAWMLDDDQRLLAKLKADYEQRMGELGREHERARRAAASEVDRAAIDRQFGQRRAQRTQRYENQRRAIFGWPPASQPSPTTRPAAPEKVR